MVALYCFCLTAVLVVLMLISAVGFLLVDCFGFGCLWYGLICDCFGVALGSGF